MPKPTIGVIFHPRFPPETLADFARRAEAGGFDELWLWDDCFLPGGFTSAAIALAATQTIKVGIGLLPATAYNPLFAAMEITTLARAFPNRLLPGFGHGVGSWMAQIGAAPRSSLKALEETVIAVARLLAGETVTMHGEAVHLERVKMELLAASVPPLYVGAMRQNTLRLAGRVGDGTILTGMSSPTYMRWACEQVHAGMAESGHTAHKVAVYLDAKVSIDGQAARASVRQALAVRYPWADIQLQLLGIAEDVAAFVKTRGVEDLALHMPDEWLNEFAAVGTPEEAAGAIHRLADAGADTIILQPLNGDPNGLDEYVAHLMPLLNG